MNKLLLVIVGVIVIIGVGAYFFMSNKQKAPSLNPTTNQPTSVPTTKNSLLDLLTQGRNLTCEYNATVNTSQSSGTVYLSGKNIRVDYAITVEGKKNTGSMIRDENYTYLWGSAMAGGIKMKNTSLESSTNNAQTNQYFNPSTKQDYKCQAWLPNTVMFTPPTNITFSEFSIPSPQVSVGAVNQGNSAACEACNSLSGQAKTMCLTQLKCE